MLPIKSILYPTDFSEPSRAALTAACELAEHFGAELHLLHVIPFSDPFPTDLVAIAVPNMYPSDRERTDEALKLLDDLVRQYVPSTIHTHTDVKMGSAGNEITCAAADVAADVIVMGTHGETGLRHLVFGSVAEKVVQMAHRPVLTVHSGPLRGRIQRVEDMQPETEPKNLAAA